MKAAIRPGSRACVSGHSGACQPSAPPVGAFYHNLRGRNAPRLPGTPGAFRESDVAPNICELAEVLRELLLERVK